MFWHWLDEEARGKDDPYLYAWDRLGAAGKVRDDGGRLCEFLMLLAESIVDEGGVLMRWTHRLVRIKACTR